MTKNEMEQLAKTLAPRMAQSKATELFSMSKEEAESYGAFEETALSAEELDGLYEDFLRECFIKTSDERS